MYYFCLCTAAPGDDRRTAQTQGRAQPVAGFGQHAVCNAQPEQGGDDVHAAVCRINPPASGRMQGKQIGKQCKAGGGRQQQPRAFALPQPQIGQPAADDFGQRGKEEEQQGFEDGGVHGWLVGCRLLFGRRFDYWLILKRASYGSECSAAMCCKSPIKRSMVSA